MAGAGRRGSTYSSVGKRDKNEFTTADLLGGLIDAINKQAVEPNLHAYQPHAKQIAFHESDKHQRLFIGGNRSGKTVAGVTEDLWWATRRHPYRRIPSDTIIRGRVLGDGFDNGTINEVLIPTFKRWIIPSDLINGSWDDSWSNRDHTLTFENGSFIEFKSYDQDIQKHAGTSRHFIHFDEEPPQTIFAESMLRLVDTNGSWWMTMTPLNGMNWVYDDLYLKGKAGELQNMLVVEVVSTENPYVHEGALEILLATLSEEEKEQRKMGKFAERGGKVFPEFSVDNLMDGPWYPDEYDGWRIYQSLDHGLNNPTAALWHAVSSDNQVITFGEHYKTNMLVKEHAQNIKAFEALHGLNVYARPGDPAMKQRQAVTGTSIVQEYGIHGIFLNVDVPRDVATGLDRMRTYMKPDALSRKPRWLIVKDQCPNLVRELERLSWKTYASAKQRDAVNKLEEVKKKDDHAFDSARYFFTMMPDLSPSAVWHFEDPNKPKRLKSYLQVLEEMSQVNKTAWQPVHKGFSQEEFKFEDGMESIVNG